jgi:hypothetical protein
MTPTNKRLFIQTIQSVPLWGEPSSPTVLHYSPDSECQVGYAAEKEAGDALEVNRDFKVDLGRLKPGASNAQSFGTADGKRRSALILTRDFLSALIRQASDYLKANGVSQATRIIVAEPLNMYSEENAEWLQNYRSHLRGLLAGVTFRGAENIQVGEIDFLPEPFAAFQYYRYGVRSPAVVGRQKYCALVLDFGGGTFDVCVIETTQDGDISQSGRNSKPFGSASIPVGGFSINRKIVEYLLRTHIVGKGPEEQKQFDRALRKYYAFRNNQEQIEDLAPELRYFIENFQRTAFEIERIKLRLCRLITDWRLGAPLAATEEVLLPSKLFAKERGVKLVVFSAVELRKIFEEDVWKEELAPVVRNALCNAQQSLRGHPVNVVLLSGGSANIGWLEHLLRRDFEDELMQADVLPLENYQEVVSKGLAVECARRFYTDSGGGDFESIVYNPLWLLLDVADTGIHPRKLQPLDDFLPDCSAQPALLLDAATPIQDLTGKPLNWKVRNTGPIPKKLNYYFLRTSGANPGPEAQAVGVSLDDRLNFEEHHITAGADARYDSDLRIRLLLRPDGTAEPTFVYQAANKKVPLECKKEGRPFFIEMTTGQKTKHTPQMAYLGLDFGTSNSSIAFVNHSTIRTMEERSKHAAWQELADLPARLPHPLAEPLQAYLGEHLNRDKQASYARQFIEACLTLMFISGYLDLGFQKAEAGSQSKTTRLLVDYRVNSAGPVWARIKEIYKSPRHLKTPRIAKAWFKLVEPGAFEMIDNAVKLIAAVKHEKADVDDIEWHDTLHLMGNTAAAFSDETHFGFFEDVEQAAFGDDVTGCFRHAIGKPPFPKRTYLGLPKVLPQRQPYLFNPETRTAFPLAPFYIFKRMDHANDFEHGLLLTLDTIDTSKKSISYKSLFRTPAFYCGLSDKEVSGLVKAVVEWAGNGDPTIQPLSPVGQVDA